MNISTANKNPFLCKDEYIKEVFKDKQMRCTKIKSDTSTYIFYLAVFSVFASALWASDV